RPLPLDLFSPDEARAMLVGRLGAARVAAEPTATDAIIARCARLPLALAIAAARADTQPDFPLAAVASQLDRAPPPHRFAPGGPATDARAVFSWSSRELSTDAARLFRLLGLHPGPDVTTPAAASLAAIPAPRARDLLAELSGAHLLTEPSPGRYGCHDLLR